MDTLLNYVQTVNGYLSDYVLIVLLVATGLFFSIRTRFVQVRCFGEGMRKVFGKISFFGKSQESGLSSFQALATAIAAQVGTGNIVGASGAILTGGPGAIFWMWVVAFLGMSTIYAEAVLAQSTRVMMPDKSIHGGPVYYIKHAFSGKFGTFMAVFFAVSCVISLGFIGVSVQSNSIAETCRTAFNVPEWGIGLFLVVIAGIIFLGGISRIASVTEKMVPMMACLYLIGGIVILVSRITLIPATFACIFRYAFTPEALIGGGIGAALKIAVSQGVKRGLFSNEAGMGSTPHAHAQANVPNAHEQGVVAMTGVFIDTFVVLTMTALIVISTFYVGDGALAKVSGKEVAMQQVVVETNETVEVQTTEYKQALSENKLAKTNLVQKSFHKLIGEKGGNIFVAICLFFFAFSTILSWSFFGKINFCYLFGTKLAAVYSGICVLFIFLGTMMQNDLVWELQDMFNQLMVLPNAVTLLVLSGIVVKAVKNHNDVKAPDIANKQ